MRSQDRSTLPLCVGCGARHYPATTGAGFRVWCDGSSADTNAERMRIYRERAEHEREQREREHARDRFRIEHARRADAPALELWERSAPDTLPESI